jgi:DNA-binding winged helix-turn-helix (wHTH) protein
MMAFSSYSLRLSVSGEGPALGSVPPVQPAQGTAPEFEFRDCRLIPGARILLRKGSPVEIGSRAFDLLHLLLAHRGTILGKDVIVAHVWPSTVVDESNLRLQVSMLRKALGPDRDLIKNVPGRGYLFLVDSECLALPSNSAGQSASSS